MSDDPSRARHERLASEAIAAGKQAAAALERAGGRQAGPGDLFVVRETAEFPVEWLVVESARRDPRLLYLVPADTNPLLGSADWAIAAGPATGPLALRCRYGVWLDASHLDPALHAGRLAPEALAPAARRCAAIRDGSPAAAGAAAGSPAGGDADDDPEYEDWLAEVVAPARGAIAAFAGTPAGEGFRLWRWRWRRPWRWQLVAASLSLVLALALGAALSREARQVRLLRGELSAMRAALGRQPQPGPVNGAGPPPAAAATEGDVIPNLPLVYLHPETLRGGAEKLRVEAGPQRLVVLAIEPAPCGACKEYRLEIRNQRTGRLVWRGSGLHLDPASGLVEVGVRQRLLPPGVYELRLDGFGGVRSQGGQGAARAVPAGRYSLEVEAEAAPTTAAPVP
jgi:hypothetical protein